MKPDHVLFLLGISRKAGKLISGQETVERAVNAKKVFLIMVSNDASNNTKEKMKSLGIKGKIPVFYCYHSDELGKAIPDKGLAKEIQRRIKQLTGVGDIDEITRV